ncbi:N-formylglutamate amidohydrolase [Hyphomicrobium sp. D-2]|uniref:N-formylglutamate amidohydrolase n=1 Tax=Hyphomicrobium sp. D-2 TaxID=3041621 RepID=UPI0024559B56|nr:N-formylglutamate amidohydrolase [Hyphomicrobium sp. D-2]MDH4982341.1 N-formylglutamate amidohydrolase [Hyphomicrobium sp. D-2]
MLHLDGCGPSALAVSPDPESYELIPGRDDAGLIVLCDHATNIIPEGYGSLGLPAAELQRHIAYDIGAAAVTKHLASRLSVPAILTRFSRLLIDPNRGLDDPTLVMRISDGAVIAGNRHLDEAEREKRVGQYYEPYHRRIDQLIESCVAAGVPPVLLSVHSFTDNWKGVARPWHAAILWDRDYRFAVPLLNALRTDSGIVVGENEPYDGKLAGDSMWRHGTRRGLAHAIIEIRQDLITHPEGQQAWAERIAQAIESIFAEAERTEELHQVRYFGSHTDTDEAPPYTSPAERNAR